MSVSKWRRIALLILPVLIATAVYTQLTIFVVQPLGAVPEGGTVVIWRRQKTQFVDSADAVCQREAGGVSLLCRAGVLRGIVGDDGSGILFRLPYSEALYLISTGGVKYDR